MRLFGHHRHRRNPLRLGGIDFRRAGWLLGGLVGTAVANDRFVFPFVAKHLSGLVGPLGTSRQRAINGATTTGTAIVGGMLLHDLDPEGVQTAALGGAALGVGRIVLSPIGGDISVAVPGLAQTLAPQLAQHKPAALPPGQSVAPAIGAPQATVSPSSYL